MGLRIDTEDVQTPVLLRVKSSSSVASLAASISEAVNEGHPVTLRAIGAGAINQTMKAIATANSFVAPKGVILDCRPGFATVSMPDGSDVTAMVFRLLVH